MKNNFKALIAFFFIMFVFTGCFDPPEFPAEPRISFNNIEFVDREGTDSLILTFDFEDGDGDIGLRPQDNFPPYNSFFFVIDNRGEVVTFSGEGYELPFYKIAPTGDSLSLLSETDNRPTYNCLNYQDTTIQVTYGTNTPAVSDDSTVTISDTLYIVQNEFNKNLFIKMFRKIQGEYVNIDSDFALDPRCPETFDARFPVFDTNNMGRALSGSISYTLASVGFPVVFRNDSIMIEFFIYDRSLNKSNVVRTPDFLLSDITK